MNVRGAKILCAVGLAVLVGCGEKPASTPNAGTYGTFLLQPTQQVERAGSVLPVTWTNSELAVIETELSPATLYHSTSRTLSFFTHMPDAGIGGPTFVAMSTEFGPKIFQPGQKMEPALMRESWFVVWFAGATNWTNWDSPHFLTLQHRPAKMSFDSNGLHFTFTNQAGYAALMPMYGDYKPGQLATQPLPFYQIKEKKKRVLTWEWYKALPADPLGRARYWASALREFPISCEDRFSVDTAHDSVTIRETFQWLSWNDDWNTKHWKLAPVSPVLAHAYKEGFPAEFSKKPYEMEILTSFGPYFGVENVDSYDVTLPVLNYVNETAGVGTGTSGWSNAPCFAAWQQAHASGAWDSLRPRWPALREEFLKRTAPDWAAFAGLNVSPLEQAADALGAARIAYRLGDADTYVTACARFARALTQLSAQQHGLNYFRERQPWRSMQPLDTNATLSVMTANGWSIEQRGQPALPDGLPDIARLMQDAQPNRPPPPASVEKLERLIPAQPPTAFVAADDNPSAGFSSSLFFQLQAKEREPIWPRSLWMDWKTPTGASWNFGEVVPSTNTPSAVRSESLHGNTRVTIYSAP